MWVQYLTVYVNNPVVLNPPRFFFQHVPRLYCQKNYTNDSSIKDVHFTYLPAAHLDAMLRSLVIGRLGRSGHKDTIAEAKKRFAAHCSSIAVMPADLRAPVSGNSVMLRSTLSCQDQLSCRGQLSCWG